MIGHEKGHVLRIGGFSRRTGVRGMHGETGSVSRAARELADIMDCMDLELHDVRVRQVLKVQTAEGTQNS